MKRIIRTAVICILLLSAITSVSAKEEYIVGLSSHELGDTTFSLQTGLFIPAFFQDFTGQIHSSEKLSLGVTGAIQWNVYLNEAFRIGLEAGGAFSFGPDLTNFIMVPITIKAGYVFNWSRFEFPVFIGMGINIIKYDQDLTDIGFIIKPGFSAYWRHDSNLSYGLNFAWLWTLEAPAQDYGGVMSNAIEISPALFYHF